MGAKQILILFFSTMALSLVVLTVVFNLVFNKMDLSFKGRALESAPTFNGKFEKEDGKLAKNLYVPDDHFGYFRADGIRHATVVVPEEFQRSLPPKTDFIRKEEEETTEETASTEPSIVRQEVTPVRDRDEDVDALPSPVPTPRKTETPKKAEPKPQALVVPPSPVVPQAKRQPFTPPVMPAQKPTAPSARPVTPAKPLVQGPPVPPPPPTSPEKKKAMYSVYMDGFKTPEQAQSAAQKLKSQGVEAYVNQGSGRPVVKMGSFSSKENADAMAGQVGAKVQKLP